jgi:hypothetical protein
MKFKMVDSKIKKSDVEKIIAHLLGASSDSAPLEKLKRHGKYAEFWNLSKWKKGAVCPHQALPGGAIFLGDDGKQYVCELDSGKVFEYKNPRRASGEAKDSEKVESQKGWTKESWENLVGDAVHPRKKCMELLSGKPGIDDVGALCNFLYQKFGK